MTEPLRGSPKFEAFLAIEDGVKDALGGPLLAFGDAEATLIAVSLEKGAYDDARRHIEAFDPAPWLRDQEDRLVSLAASAYLFGAGCMVPLPTATAIRDGVPDAVVDGARRHLAMFAKSTAELVKARATQLLHLYETRSTPAGAGHRPFQKMEARPHPLDDRVRLLKADTIFDVDALAEAMHGVVMGTATAARDITGNLITTRFAAFGALDEARKNGLGAYRWEAVLDDKTCPVCGTMHGRVFPVDPGFVQLEHTLAASDPEDLKALHPWPKQDKASVAALQRMSTDELVAEGFSVPPLHPACRCVLTGVGEEWDALTSRLGAMIAAITAADPRSGEE